MSRRAKKQVKPNESFAHWLTSYIRVSASERSGADKMIARVLLLPVYCCMLLLCCRWDVTNGLVTAIIAKSSDRCGRYPTKLYVGSIEAPLGVIEAAVQTRNIEKQEVVKALQTLERNYKDKPVAETAIKGRWEFIFTNSVLAQEAGFLFGGYLGGYFPTKEVITFNENGIITLKGGLFSRFQGESTIVSSRPLTLEYVFQDFKIGPIGQDGMAKKLRGYQFIYVGDINGIAVSRILPSGAYAILKRCK